MDEEQELTAAALRSEVQAVKTWVGIEKARIIGADSEAALPITQSIDGDERLIAAH